MSFRTRLTLVAAVAVAVAVAVASAVTYVVVRGQLRGQFDDSLRSTAANMQISVGPSFEGGCRLFVPPEGFGGPRYDVQLVQPDGSTCRSGGIEGTAQIPVSAHDRAIARGDGNPYFRDITVAGTHARVLTAPATNRFGQVGALQVARSLGEVDHALGRIRLFLILIAVGGILGAALLGLVVARAALLPVRRLTQTAEDVSETRDLSRRIDARGRDELSRLATTFNTMLAALEDSARAQRQLVSDASHELRTPLTSLRTNIDVLARADELPVHERDQLLKDVDEQLREMTSLVAELVELARGERQPQEPVDVRLDLVTAEAILRTMRNRPGVTFDPKLEESLVRGVPSTIERAVSNLLDNAAKWSPPGSPIEVAVQDGEVVVRDHGPGIDASDLPYVFDRFYRAPAARSMPGSGLGLAIVRQVAEAHGGSVTAESPEEGGTVMRLRLGN